MEMTHRFIVPRSTLILARRIGVKKKRKKKSLLLSAPQVGKWGPQPTPFLVSS